MTNVLCVFIIISAFFLSLKKNTIGVCFFFAVRILVPENVRVSERMSLNTAVILVVAIVVFVKHFIQLPKLANDKYLHVLLLFVLFSAFLLPFSGYGDLQYQYHQLFQFMITDVFPPILLIFTIDNDEDIIVLEKSFVIVCIITCSYGVLAFLLNNNPYLNLLNPEILYYSNWKGRSTSATFVHNTGFGYYLTMMLPYLFYLKSKYTKDSYINMAVILVLIDVILCKKRTAFVACAAFLIACFIYKQNKKMLKLLMIFSLFIAGIVIWTVPKFDTLKNYTISSMFFWNDKAVSGLSTGDLGSSWALRTRQIWYPFVEVSEYILFGNGFGWTTWYKSTYGIHWLMFGFETVLSVAVCEYGLLGYFIYGTLFYQSYKYSKANHHNRKVMSYQFLFIFVIIIMAIGSGLNYHYLFFGLIVLMRRHESIFGNYRRSFLLGRKGMKKNAACHFRYSSGL